MNRPAARFLASAWVLLLSLAAPAWGMNASESPTMRPVPTGHAFPNLVFPGPFTAAETAALGLKPDATSFKLADIKADTVLLVVFSMYCPFCQKEGPVLVKMNAMLRERGLAGKVAMVGLAAGNSPFEAGVYRDKFKVDFPIFHDQDFSAYKAVGQVGTPYYYVLKREGDGFVVVDGQLGCVASAEAFLDTVLEKAAAKGKKK